MIKEGEKQMNGAGERGGIERCRMKTNLQQGEPAQREPRPSLDEVHAVPEHKTSHKVMTYE